jgi:EAL and modified HD-GYP domain-containing signal transduction protein
MRGSTRAKPVAAPPAEQVMLARQPILDTRRRVVAYELLYRPIAHGGSPPNPSAATANVLVNAVSEIGLSRLVGAVPAFINVTREFVLADLIPNVPPDRVVLELVEDQLIDDELLAALAALRRRGLTLALDDFRYTPEQEPLVALAGIAKLDVQALDPVTLARDARRLKARGLRLIAEKVETADELERCVRLGFDAFQGYYFAKPASISGRRAPTSQLATLCAILAAGPDTDIDTLQTVIARDLSLSQRVLRLANAAAVSPATPVGSLRHALTMLGTARIRRKAAVICLAGIRDAPEIVLTTALVRARMAERLAPLLPDACPDRAFTVGLFSLLDSLLGRPLETLVQLLPFDGGTTAALVHHRGPEGHLLDVITAHERGLPGVTEIAAHDLATSYRDAIAWADATVAMIA